MATTFTTFFKAYPISIPAKKPPPIVAANRTEILNSHSRPFSPSLLEYV